MEKLKFSEPEVEVIIFDERDVITGSKDQFGGGGGDNSGVPANPFDLGT